MSLGRSAAGGDAGPVDGRARMSGVISWPWEAVEPDEGWQHDEVVVELRVPADRRFHATGRLVAGGLAARLGFDVDELDDVRLAVEALLLQQPAGQALTLTLMESEDALDLRVGPFDPTEDVTGLRRVLDTLGDDFRVQDSEQGRWIAATVVRRRGVRGSR